MTEVFNSRKLYIQWEPKMFTNLTDHKIVSPRACLDHFNHERDDYCHIVVGGEMWILYDNVEKKRRLYNTVIPVHLNRIVSKENNGNCVLGPKIDSFDDILNNYDARPHTACLPPFTTSQKLASKRFKECEELQI
ncbi:hypothetical protein Trydic_g7422 [Trypoxylus dichotomus]